MKTKFCNKCSELKNLNDFSKNCHAKDGLQSRCRLCDNAYQKGLNGMANDRIHQLVEERERLNTELPTFEISCYYDDIQQTKIFQNRHFLSGDGGYKDFVNSMRP